MKTFTVTFSTLILLLFSAGKTIAQNPIPNPDFENWGKDTINTMTSSFVFDHPTDWGPFISGFYWAFSSGNGPLSCYKSNDKYSGNYALQLTTESDSAGADMVTVFPIANRPLQLNGYYKFTPAAGDTAFIIVGITKGDPIGWAFGDTSVEVGTGTKGFATTATATYLPFSVPLTYKDLTTFPDSAIIVITSTQNFGSGTPGQKLWVDNLYFSGTSGIDEETLNNGIRVYPNPARNYVNVEFRNFSSQDNIVEILDLSGRSVLSGISIPYFDSIDVSSLEKGIYILRVKNSQGIFSRKIVKN